MLKKQNRWIITTVMALVALAFAGLSIAPLLGAFQNTPQVAASPSSPQERLETEAKGYELVLQREPDNQAALRGLIEVRVQQGNIEAIVPVLEKLAEQNPDQADYQVLLAQTKQRTGDLEGAAQAYRTVLETRPGDINALKGLSDLLIQQERPQAAIGLLEETLNTADAVNQAQPGTIDPTSVRVLLGEVYFKQQRYEDAIATYDQAAQINPEDFRPILGKALVLQAQGKTEEAAPLFASAESLAPAQFKDQVKQLAAAPSPSPVPTTEVTPEEPAVESGE
ncbi:tetratricopeptide repeat protein [Thermocoleostomius sinensis]|uniref:Tetratricopeptide repeat protein n=1 Tax=Thermocoleostomius sinensis A174 TaxID=2016057 RepID=A0A9E8ZPP4_9CYAN|nr:tetratricopeptide repeat protein [Thermocoleostomius sinensis]WAL62681.1 tetratricopeptide repeat protein [Thermocoleostomius sinensis A174]